MVNVAEIAQSESATLKIPLRKLVMELPLAVVVTCSAQVSKARNGLLRRRTLVVPAGCWPAISSARGSGRIGSHRRRVIGVNRRICVHRRGVIVVNLRGLRAENREQRDGDADRNCQQQMAHFSLSPLS
jgi:hypothetical protein